LSLHISSVVNEYGNSCYYEACIAVETATNMGNLKMGYFNNDTGGLQPLNAF